jgi:hypothetical protein
MEISIGLPQGLQLKIADGLDSNSEYPSSSLQKAFLLVHNGRSMAQEAVGFGFPVIKRGLTALFPGSVKLSSNQQGKDKQAEAVYTLNLKEKIIRQGKKRIQHEIVYTIKNFMALLIRRVAFLRGILTGVSNALRKAFGWETAYEDAGVYMKVKVTYTVPSASDEMRVDVDWAGQANRGITELIVMNEQGADHFDQYTESSGNCLQGNKIGCWDEVFAHEASFIGAESHVRFTLSQVNGARLYCGRERIGSRLAWAGFGYSVNPAANRFSYTIKIDICQ